MSSCSKDALEIRQFMENTANARFLLPSWLKSRFPTHLGPASKREIFLKCFPPDKRGRTRRVCIEELTEIYFEFGPGNGCDWARSRDGLGSEFIVKRYDRNGRITNNGNAVHYIELAGYNRGTFKQTIPQEVRDFYRGCSCVRCHSKCHIQMDHKIGLKIKTAKGVEEYQPLCQRCNIEKREWCKKCRRTGLRPDPREVLAGTWWEDCPVGWIKGNRKLDRSLENPCEGCFCYDFRAFGHVAWRM